VLFDTKHQAKHYYSISLYLQTIKILYLVELEKTLIDVEEESKDILI